MLLQRSFLESRSGEEDENRSIAGALNVFRVARCAKMCVVETRFGSFCDQFAARRAIVSFALEVDLALSRNPNSIIEFVESGPKLNPTQAQVPTTNLYEYIYSAPNTNDRL